MKNKIAYFETPKDIVNIMLSLSKNINKSVLDTGFGDGAFLNEIIKLNKSKEITGIELDEEFYTKMKNNNIDNCNLINEDYLSYEFNKKFDLIIGNPPYITNDNLPFKIKEEIKKLSGSGEGNIYYAFILKSIETLKENGELIYIVPYDFFFNTYAKQLRNKLIKDGYFDTIIDFGETNIFKGASPEIIIFKWIKNTKIKQKINVYKLNKSDKLNILISNLNKTIEENNTNIYFNNFEIENFKDDKIWSLSDFTYYKNTKRLADLANVGVGIVNGAENIFFIKQNDLNKFTIKEKEMYIKTFIKSKNVNNCVITDLNNSNYIFINNDLTEDELKIYKCL